MSGRDTAIIIPWCSVKKMETSSRDQAGGGLRNCPRRTQYSKEMLKLMMQESRLTNFQQRQINDKLKKGSALPLTCNPTSSAPPSLTAQTQSRKKNSTTRTPAKPLRRTADNCSSGDNYTRDRFRPSATRDLEKRRRHQNILATGQEEPRPNHPRNISLDQGPEERDRFQEVLDEIEERKEFGGDDSPGEREAVSQHHQHRDLTENL
ncbi:UPF0193 protein EVG1 homolog isoform X1 [Salmo trutta]|uniref:UPF0193 protein EVG1 homolog isoform X1 n=1 Tax=Salmo trutta TaxID=8032 RepID=UPI00113219DF|nr:UPF0193 protein EVG1 homolog isoform X1 [Salmo trutta]